MCDTYIHVEVLRSQTTNIYLRVDDHTYRYELAQEGGGDCRPKCMKTDCTINSR